MHDVRAVHAVHLCHLRRRFRIAESDHDLCPCLDDMYVRRLVLARGQVDADLKPILREDRWHYNLTVGFALAKEMRSEEGPAVLKHRHQKHALDGKTTLACPARGYRMGNAGP